MWVIDAMRTSPYTSSPSGLGTNEAADHGARGSGERRRDAGEHERLCGGHLRSHASSATADRAHAAEQENKP